MKSKSMIDNTCDDCKDFLILDGMGYCKYYDKIVNFDDKDCYSFEEKGKDFEKLLKNPKLFELIDSELDKKITGEKQSRRTLVLSCLSVFVKDMKIPMNTLVSSASSAGKSYICKHVTGLFPKDLVIYRTKISGETLTYWKIKEKGWTWDGKILFLEDISQSVLDSPTFRVMGSEGSIATVVRNQKAIDLIIKGKPCMLITTASTEPSEELMNRFSIIQLDESAEQTEAIALAEALGNKKEAYNPAITRALNNLERIEASIPFAKKIQQYITKNYGWQDIRMRRDFNRLLNLIKCSTALYQYQRKEKDHKLIATEQDYEIARECINYIQTMTLKGMTHQLKKCYEACLKEVEFTASKIYEKYPFIALNMWYHYLDDLCRKKLLTVNLKDVEGVRQKVRHYTVKGSKDLHLPEFKDLK